MGRSRRPPSGQPRSATGPAPAASDHPPSLAGVLLGALVTVGAFAALAAALHAVPPGRRGLPDHRTWSAGVADDLPGRLLWLLGDVTAAQFYAAWPASVGLVAGALLAWWLQRGHHRFGGTPITYGTGLWPWLFGAGGLSLALSNLFFGGRLDQGWQPTFVPFVCVAGAVVLVYGRGWPTLLTGAVLGVPTTPLAMLLIAVVTDPAGLPPVVANTAAMSIGTAAGLLLCRWLPWMARPRPDDQGPTPRRPRTSAAEALWTIRRVLTDFSEPQFYGTEWAGAALVAGAVVSHLLNPAFAVQGTGLLPRVLLAQALTSAVGIVVWRRRYVGAVAVPTYIPVVSVAPATVLAHGDSTLALVLGALAGAVVCPVVAGRIAARLPEDVHPFVANVATMALVTAVVVPVVGRVT